MIKVEELGGLGHEQKIETGMAREVNLEVFRTYTNSAVLEDEDRSEGIEDDLKSYPGVVGQWVCEHGPGKCLRRGQEDHGLHREAKVRKAVVAQHS